MRRNVEIFTAVGAPGAASSTDGVAIPNDCTPEGARQDSMGKRDIPTVVLQISVNHEGDIIHATSVFRGGINDKSLSRFDDWVLALKDAPYCTEVEFKLYNVHGEQYTEKGLWGLFDGGYFQWRICQSPLKVTGDLEAGMWSELVPAQPFVLLFSSLPPEMTSPPCR